ncbi:histidine-containing phosphotransfer protein 1-like protein [Carex littledalei]|uniref:Histidine-containing phosphotransfer protein n=1 Tax=Carex littledalei TaxID=544730 RepID=A0A833VXW6_9POAL|nr:histidine-containing phosphotransfer protein 1-like protein [Carex littledalei]
MDVSMLQRTYLELLSSLFSEFTTLQKLQDKDDPKFVFRTVSLFFDNAERLINGISSNLNQPTVEFNKIKELVHQLKGSNKFIGGERIEDACVAFRSYCDANDLQGCFSSMQQLNQEFLNFKSKLDTLFTMEQQIVAAGGSIPKMQ